MTTYRRYTFVTQLERGHAEAQDALWTATITHWWFKDPLVSGEGKLEFSFTVCGRDQWFTHKRAMGLAVNTVYSAGGLMKDVPLPVWVKLAPHTNRGYLRH